MAVITVSKPDKKFIQRIKQAGAEDVSKCYQCATCSAVCNLTPEDRPFPRKEMILAQWGQKQKLLADPDVWLCHQCNDCSVRCPRGARPGDVMAAIRNYAFEHFAVPGFMGHLLSKPAGLPILFLIPIIIISLLADWSQISVFSGHVHFYNFINNGPVEMLWMGGNALIFLLAMIGLLRFYKGLQETWNLKPQTGFIGALIQTVLEIVLHKRFSSCDASRYRQTAHVLVIFGFVGAMTTAGLAVLRMLYLHHLHLDHFPLSEIPMMQMYHPIKLLGNASGLAMIIGLIIMIVRRLSDPETAGMSKYSQWLFLWVILGVASTGMLIQFLRLGDLPMLAYSFYFIHLVLVFFLLWYAPYSQFGHMFYRTLAMIYARSVGRLPKNLT